MQSCFSSCSSDRYDPQYAACLQSLCCLSAKDACQNARPSPVGEGERNIMRSTNTPWASMLPPLLLPPPNEHPRWTLSTFSPRHPQQPRPPLIASSFSPQPNFCEVWWNRLLPPLLYTRPRNADMRYEAGPIADFNAERISPCGGHCFGVGLFSRRLCTCRALERRDAHLVPAAPRGFALPPRCQAPRRLQELPASSPHVFRRQRTPRQGERQRARAGEQPAITFLAQAPRNAFFSLKDWLREEEGRNRGQVAEGNGRIREARANRGRAQ
jgi:hypothetical protein